RATLGLRRLHAVFGAAAALSLLAMSEARLASLVSPRRLASPPGGRGLETATAIAPNESPEVAARRGGRPSRQQTAALQQTILDSAAALFLTRGYGATSIEAVAAGARISKRTFYHRFRDKA